MISVYLATSIAISPKYVARWMRSNRFQLDTDRRLSSSDVRRHGIRIGFRLLAVELFASASNLGIYIDAHLSMRRHVDVVVARCFVARRQLQSFRQYATPAYTAQGTGDVTDSHPLGLRKLSNGWCASDSTSSSTALLGRLRPFNLLYGRFDHVTSALLSIH
jgi:hypothetical protein